MESTAFNTAEPIMDEIRLLNTFIPLVQAGTVKHFKISEQFPANKPEMLALANTRLTANDTDWLAELQARLTNRQTALAAV